jgi:predicted dehydrogenase
MITAALIGVGGYGQVHLRHLHALESEGLLRLAAVADPFLYGAPLAAVKADLSAAGVRLYDDFNDLCARESGVDLIVIAAPIPWHEVMVNAALATGARIYLEKPPVPTIQQWTRLVEADVRGQIAVGFQMLAMEHLLKLRGWIAAGDLGEIESIAFGALWPRATSYYQRAGWAGRLVLDGEPVFDGPATNALSHVINNVMFLAGATLGGGCAVPESVAGEFYRARADIESYDLASLSGRFINGVRFAGTLGHCFADIVRYTIRVQGARGAAWLADDGRRLESDCALPASHDAGAPDQAVATHYRETVAWAAGRRAGPVCSLRDSEGYMRTVNAGFVSSGGVHSIPGEEIGISGQTGESVHAVHGLDAAVRASIAGAVPLSGTGLWWARPGREIKAGDVAALDLAEYLNDARGRARPSVH